MSGEVVSAGDSAPPELVAELVSGARTESTPVRVIVGEFLAGRRGNTRAAYADHLGYRWRVIASAAGPVGAERDVSRLRNGKSFLPWCEDRGLDPFRDVTRRHILWWIDDLAHSRHPVTGRPLTEITQGQLVSAVSRLYGWACEHGYAETNPVVVDRAELRLRTKTRVSTTRSLDRSEVARIQQAADEDPVDAVRARSSAIVAVLFDVGLRVSELCNLTVRDGQARMQGQRVLWLTLKGGDRHVVALPKPAVERLDRYLATRPEATPLPARRGEVGGVDRPLFATATGKPMHRSEVLRLVKRLAAQAGIELPGEVSPHVARHSWITTAREEGIEDSRIQRHVGHRHGSTTDRYGRHVISVANSPAMDVAAAYRSARDDRRPPTTPA